MNHHSTKSMAWILAFWIGSVNTVGAWAESMDPATRVPGDSLLYFTWAGCDRAAKAAKETAFGKTLAEPQVAAFLSRLGKAIDEFVQPRAAEQIGQETYAQLRRVALDVIQHPGMLAVNKLGMTELGPAVEVVLAFELGDAAERFVTDLEAALQSTGALPPAQPVTLAGKPAKQLPLPVPGGAYYGVFDGHFVLGVGKGGIERFIAPPPDPNGTLAGNASFKLARTKIGGGQDTRLMSLYVDLVQAWAVIEQIVAFREQQGAARQIEALGPWRGIRAAATALGLDKLASLNWEVHIQKRGFRNCLFIHTKTAPSGLLGLGKGEPVTTEDLEWIPQEPYWASVFPLEAGAWYDLVMHIIETADADLHKHARAAIEQFESRLNLKLDADLLDLISGRCIAYDAAENGGLWITGVALIIETPDAGRLAASLEKLTTAIAGHIKEPNVALSARQMVYRDVNIHYANLSGAPMPVAPAWAEVGGRVVLGLTPQTIEAVIDRRLNPERRKHSLITNPDVVAAREVLGGIGYSLVYSDTRLAIRQVYSFALPAAYMLLGMAQAEGFDFDASHLPTAETWARHMFGHVGTAQRSDDGVMFTSYGPLPFGMPALGEAPTAATTAVMASILLPSLSRARTLAKRVKSAANLRQIGTACFIYANDHNEAMPPDLQALVTGGEITQETLNAPQDEPGKVSYVYYPGDGLFNMDPRSIIAHERPEINEGEGANVLFADGHVEFVKMPEFERLLEQSKRQSNRDVQQ